MTRGQLGIVLVTTFLVFCTLYTPQPILPQLARDLGVPMTDAALVITVTLLPLGLAPIFYGYFLQAVPAKTMLRIALALLAVDQVLLFFVDDFATILALRFAQGLMMPALFTALMTYAASMAAPGQVRVIMGMYISATIVGGFFSRALSGYLASTLGWQWVFLVLGLALLIPAWLCGRLRADAELNFNRLDARAIGRVLRVPDFAWSYLALATLFVGFTGMLAMLPFRIEAIRPESGSFLISLVYLGYMVGIPVALASDRLVAHFQREKTVLLIGAFAILVGFGFYLLPSVPVLFGFMLVLAAGMFLIHSTLSGFLNHAAPEHKGVVNGIYVSVYYLSGTLGSWLPLLMYRQIGWDATIVIFMVLTALSGWFFSRLTATQPPASAPETPSAAD